MSDYPQLCYSMKAVRRAGKKLATGVAWDESRKAEILETFAIAYSWRDSHVLPMRSIRLSVAQRMRHADIPGFTAARPKRMSSIRRKLQRLPVQLEQINDLGGCRAVLDDIECVNTLIEECRNRVPHNLRKEWDYIASPKHDGYRSHHMLFQFRGVGEREAFDGRRVELQIRTRLQHSWATAVEAVGLYRGEDMKSGQGSVDWLRLFQLMSLEFARSENCLRDELSEQRDQRIDEIRTLNVKLRAAGVLEDMRNATRYMNEFVHEQSKYFLIRYDEQTHMVDVKPYFSALEGTSQLGALEQNSSGNVVLVEVERIEQLKEAYPNYFGDVSLFVRNLQSVCDGKDAIEFSMAPPSLVSPKPDEIIDPAWLRPRRHRRWTEERRLSRE